MESQVIAQVLACDNLRLCLAMTCMCLLWIAFNFHIVWLFQVQRVLKLLENPYSDGIDLELKKEKEPASLPEASCSVEEHSSYDSKPPLWAVDLRVTWSS